MITRRDFISRSVAAVAANSALGPALAGAAEARREKAATPIMVYVGTFASGSRFAEPYNAAPGNGRGIHIFEMDRATGALVERGVFEDASSPNCLAINPTRTHVYATQRGSGEPGSGTVSAFVIDRATGGLRLLNTVGAGGLGPTHLSVHPAGRHVFVANYIGGSVAVLPIKPNGELATASDVQELRGEIGPVKATNAPRGSFAISGHDKSHAHMIQPDPAGRFVLAANLGEDRIHIWKFDPAGGKLVPNDPPTVALPPGDGPRHFAFHPNGRWLYSLQEEASNVVWFDYDAAKCRLTARQTISTLPQGFAGTAFGSGIDVSPDGRFVYAANRLHDSIACFAIAENGSLSYVAEEWTRGNYPRVVSFDPTGNFIFSCNQRSDSVTSFRVDRKTGRLTFTGEFTPVGSATAMAFLELGPP
jgi:6-phosphogluconolactonase